MPHDDLPGPAAHSSLLATSPSPPLLRALALAWTPRHRTWLVGVLRAAGARMPAGRQFTGVDTDEGLAALAE
ncbi:MAG TPA: hypothetical protein VN324_09805, partial [Quisquiliibacterium sp.]|nr:hypothetical protein [Quisquiliibacterium sp.]